jgi:hypothetical protein
MALIREEAHEDATIIFGTYLDDSIEDDGIIIYVIATEFEDSPYNIQYQEELQKPAAVVEPEPKAAGSGIFKTPAKEFENRFNIPINATVNRAQPAYANSSNASYAYNRNIGIPGMVK